MNTSLTDLQKEWARSREDQIKRLYLSGVSEEELVTRFGKSRKVIRELVKNCKVNEIHRH
jgi:transposase